MGVASSAVSIAAIFILLAGFSKAQRWAWWAILTTGGIVVGFGTVVNFAISNRVPIFRRGGRRPLGGLRPRIHS
jgi:hypothetical protein